MLVQVFSMHYTTIIINYIKAVQPGLIMSIHLTGATVDDEDHCCHVANGKLYILAAGCANDVTSEAPASSSNHAQYVCLQAMSMMPPVSW